MAVEYTKADEVWPGKRLSSRDYNKLALAFNDRLKQGVADPSWRLFWYAHSLFRGMRNPDNNGNNWAAEDEWWKFYSHIPKDSDVFWPANGPGEGKGINLSNPMGAFIYGSEPNIDSEAGRLNPSAIFDGVENTDDPPTGVPLYLVKNGTPTAPASNADYWVLAKHQRGAWNPSLNRNFKTAVAMAAAQEHGKIDYAPSQYYLKSYGGFHGVPRVNANSPVCEDGYTPNYILRFTSVLSAATVKTYGTCPEDPSDVYMYWEGFASFNLFKFDGSVESLPLADWIEGPYIPEAYLQRVKGQQLNQTLNFFAKEYKGTTSEQENSDIVAERAFPFQDFLTSQYPLAPAYGTVSSGNITAQYKSFTKNGPHESGRTFDVGSATSYQINDTFCFAGFYASVSGNFSGEISIDVIADGDTLTTFKLSQGTDHLQYFKHPRQECLIQFKTASFLPSGANVTIEVAELLTYRPGVYDAYVVTRLASCITVSGNHDKRGETFGSAKAAGNNLLEIGCIANLSSNIGGVDSEDQINTNPVYEAGRQMVHDNLRLAERHLLVGYEVTNGKSVLYFNRYARGMDNKDLDVFRGIAAPVDAVASGNLVYGETYEVVSDQSNYGVIYNGVTYYNGNSFTANYEKDFIVSPSDSDPVAFVVPKNGIRSTPLRDDKHDRFRGQTNEWQMFVSTNVYKDSDDSIYKPESFADILGFLNDRCSFLSDSWRHSEAKASEIRRHVTYNQKPIMRPENPPGYRYLLGTHWTGDTYFPGWNSLIQSQNTITSNCQNAASSTNCDGVINHLKSCQIYKADNEIESVERNGATGVKITLKGRLDYDYAPSSIVNSLNSSGSSEGWNAAVTGDFTPTRRTDENAVLEYLIYTTSGNHCTKRVGDVAIDAGVGSGFYSNDFNGNCLPRFYFSRNIRHVWNDKPDTQSPSDTPVFSDEMLYMEFILQAICGGFVDMESTLKLTCTHQSRLYDYTFPNLCEQALRSTKYKKYWKGGPTVSKNGTTLSWAAQEGLVYDVYGHDNSSDTSTKIATGVTPTITTSTNYDLYFVVTYNYQTTEILDFTVTDTDGGGHTINFTTSDEKRVFYYLQGRANSSSGWSYWTGSTWSTNRANATDADPPVTLSSSNKKAQYRIEADYYGSKRWMEFLPADIREDNAQGFGPFPNTNLYARIFNNLVNAVNKLQRARIELPVTFEFRHSTVTYLATEKGDSGIDTDNHPLECSEGATNLASLANFGTITQEATGSYGGGAISDRALYTDATDWDTGTNIDSLYQIDLGGPFGLNGTPSEGFGCNGTSIQGALVANSGNIYLISSGYKGEIRIADDPIKYALPVAIRNQFTAAPGLLGITAHTYQKHVIDATNGSLGMAGQSGSQVPYTTNKYRAITGAIDECNVYEGGFVLDAVNNPFFDEFKSASAFSYDQRSVSSTNYFAGHGNYCSSVFTPMTSKPMWIKIDLIERDYSFNE